MTCRARRHRTCCGCTLPACIPFAAWSCLCARPIGPQGPGSDGQERLRRRCICSIGALKRLDADRKARSSPCAPFRDFLRKGVGRLLIDQSCSSARSWPEPAQPWKRDQRRLWTGPGALRKLMDLPKELRFGYRCGNHGWYRFQFTTKVKTFNPSNCGPKLQVYSRHVANARSHFLLRSRILLFRRFEARFFHCAQSANIFCNEPAPFRLEALAPTPHA